MKIIVNIDLVSVDLLTSVKYRKPCTYVRALLIETDFRNIAELVRSRSIETLRRIRARAKRYSRKHCLEYIWSLARNVHAPLSDDSLIQGIKRWQRPSSNFNHWLSQRIYLLHHATVTLPSPIEYLAP